MLIIVNITSIDFRMNVSYIKNREEIPYRKLKLKSLLVCLFVCDDATSSMFQKRRVRACLPLSCVNSSANTSVLEVWRAISVVLKAKCFTILACYRITAAQQFVASLRFTVCGLPLLMKQARKQCIQMKAYITPRSACISKQ